MPDRISTLDRRSDSMPCRLDGQGLVLEFSGFQRVPIAAQRQLVDDGEEPGDRSINGQGSWKRTCWSFDHGAGQPWWDEDKDADRRQFRTSIGIDPWDRRELKLLHGTSSVSAVSLTKLVEAGTGLYTLAADGKLDLQATPTSAWTHTGAVSTSVTDVVHNGAYVFYAKATGVVSTAPVWNNAENFDGGLYLAGGQLLGVKGQELRRFNATGTTYLVDTASGGERWGGVIDMGGETFSWTVPTFGGSDDPNRRSRLFLHRVNEQNTTLDPGDPVLELPPGEAITAGIGISNIIILGTTKGIRLVRRTSGNDLAHGGLISIPKATSLDHQVKDFAADGQYVWFTWTNIIEGKSGLGRLDLDEFIEFGVPAYAPDLTADITYTPGTTKVRSVASLNGRRFFAGNFGGYVELDTYVATGTYYSGWVNYGTPERKAVLSLGIKTHPLSAGQVVRGSVLLGQNENVRHGLVAVQGEDVTYADGSAGLSGEVISGDEVEVVIDIERGATTTATPVVRRWTLRSLPLPFRAEEIVLPIHITETVNDRGVNVSQDSEALLQHLSDLYASRRLVRLDLGGESMMVYVDGLAVERDNQVTKILGWSRRTRTLNGIWSVTCVTTDIPVYEGHQHRGASV